MVRYEIVTWNGTSWILVRNNQDEGANAGNIITAWGQQGWELSTFIELPGQPVQMIFMLENAQPKAYQYFYWNGSAWILFSDNTNRGPSTLSILDAWGQQGWKLAAYFEAPGGQPQMIFRTP